MPRPLILAPDLTCKEGWWEFVEAPVSKAPPRPTLAEWEAMTRRERAAFDNARIAHHSALGPITTPQMAHVHASLRLQAESNLHHPSGARPGSVADGDASSGKTTIITHFGRWYERAIRKRNPRERTASGAEFTPVVYVTLTPAMTPKGLARALLEYYAHPDPQMRGGRAYARSATQDELTSQVQKLARCCETSLLLFDDFHFLSPGNRSDREVNDYLKYLANVIPATFVYAGIDCEASGLLREGKTRMRERAFSQTGSRFTLHRIENFHVDTPQGAAEWVKLLEAIERELVLIKAPAGMLSKQLAQYLFDRTQGKIGSLTSLMRQGSLLAIQTGGQQFVV